MQNQITEKPYSVTKDISANLKKLKILERKGIIKIYQVKIENPTRKIENTDLPNAVLDHTKWDESLFASQEDAERFERIKDILGKANVKDAIHLDTHLREKRDYFVTEDTDILKNKNLLEKTFKELRIRSTEELVRELDK